MVHLCFNCAPNVFEIVLFKILQYTNFVEITAASAKASACDGNAAAVTEIHPGWKPKETLGLKELKDKAR